jgi:hypothetical protein
MIIRRMKKTPSVRSLLKSEPGCGLGAWKKASPCMEQQSNSKSIIRPTGNGKSARLKMPLPFTSRCSKLFCRMTIAWGRCLRRRTRRLKTGTIPRLGRARFYPGMHLITLRRVNRRQQRRQTRRRRHRGISAAGRPAPWWLRCCGLCSKASSKSLLCHPQNLRRMGSSLSYPGLGAGLSLAVGKAGQFRSCAPVHRTVWPVAIQALRGPARG